MKKGLLIILSGPSGVGKGTIRKYLMKKNSFDLIYSVSMTTRKPRDNEIDGLDYYFVSNQEFKKRIESDDFLEYAKFVDNYYGTPKDIIEKQRNEGKNVLLEIEINGASQVIQKVKDEGVLSIFLMPPSFEALEARIRKRKSESEEVIALRLEKGRKEMEQSKKYDYVVINDHVARASHKIEEIIRNKIKELS